MAEEHDVERDGRHWGERVSAVVAGEVRWHRTRLGMSAADLANACRDAGYAIPRNVLLKLEAGVRKYVTVAEVLAISRALRVPLTSLIAPVGRAASVEVAPDGTLPIDVALAWLRGTSQPDGAYPPWGIDAEAMTTLRLLDEHTDAVAQWRHWTNQLMQFRGARRGELSPAPAGLRGAGNPVSLAAEVVANAKRRLQDVRAEMRRRGEVLPELPGGLADIDEAPTSDDVGGDAGAAVVE